MDLRRNRRRSLRWGRITVRVAAVMVWLVCSCIATLAEQATSDSTDGAACRYLRSSPRLLGGFGGKRAALEDAGISLSLFYNQFLGIRARGGVDDGSSARLSGTGDFFVYAQLDRFLPWRGAEILVHVQAGYGHNVNPGVGAISDPFDDADGDSTGHIPQLWFQQTLWGGAVQLRLGYLDQQVVLDRNAYANSEDRQFMSTLLDNNNVIVPLATGLGATLFVNPADWLEIAFSTADADAHPYSPGVDTAFDNLTSLFGYMEVGLAPRLQGPRGDLPGKYRFGVIWDPREKEEFRSAEPPRTHCGDAGFYLSFDQMVYRERPDASPGLGLFARYGYRDPLVNKINHFWSLGLQYAGLLASRPQDIVGFGTYSSHASGDYQDAVDSDALRETGFEWYYLIQAVPWLTFTPDLQFIVNPGADKTVEDALVFGFRWRVTF